MSSLHKISSRPAYALLGTCTERYWRSCQPPLLLTLMICFLNMERGTLADMVLSPWVPGSSNPCPNRNPLF